MVSRCRKPAFPRSFPSSSTELDLSNAQGVKGILISSRGYTRDDLYSIEMRSLLALTSLLVCAMFSADGIASSTNSGFTPIPTPTPHSADRGKKNSRPDARSVSNDEAASAEKNRTPAVATYFYEFVRPGFAYGHVWIEHDDAGRGKISFLKDGDDEKITDPIVLSPITIKKIDELLNELDFLNSTETYQFERDFSHLGNVTFRVKKNGKERTVKYNWTANKHAKDLMDEYRRIANEYTWSFEFSVARVNQPLRTPGMMDTLDGLLRRNEISHPPHLLSFLNDVASDEKIPLIARNHATRLIKQIEKSSK